MHLVKELTIWTECSQFYIVYSLGNSVYQQDGWTHIYYHVVVCTHLAYSYSVPWLVELSRKYIARLVFGTIRLVAEQYIPDSSFDTKTWFHLVSYAARRFRIVWLIWTFGSICTSPDSKLSRIRCFTCGIDRKVCSSYDMILKPVNQIPFMSQSL